MKKIYFLLSAVSLLSVSSVFAQKSSHWKDAAEPSSPSEKSNRVVVPAKYRVLTLDVTNSKAFFKAAKKGNIFDSKNSSMIVDIPMPYGGMQQFRIVETSVMEEGLAAKYPDIKTYAGFGVTDPTASVRLDFTQKGYHAMILSSKGDVFIDPYSTKNQSTYISYYKKDYSNPNKQLNCAATPDAANTTITQRTGSALRSYQGQLRTYRLALACTVEYTNFQGGTVPAALSAMVTTMNRVNGVYEQEVGIHMNLVANTNLLIYTGNARNDPYSNDNGSKMLNENQRNCDRVIGAANYDIGHVFSTGGGGIAYLGCICTNNKAKGVTGQPAPVGDPFDIDYVAHEMGHEYGANHTFNALTGSCGGGNRFGNAAYEPGSGITIMAYAGICGINDLAPHSIAYFHSKSIDEIMAYVSGSQGGSCAVLTNTGNTAPTITSISPNYSIPVNTPFSLTGAATDANGDAVTYSWEEFDLGSGGDWNLPVGNAPIFMPLNATTSGTRLFPSLTNVLNNTNSIGNLKPGYARLMNFRLVVRDGRGGVTYNDNTVQVNVVGTGTAFEITNLNSAATLVAGASQTVTWNVSGTTAAPISAANVNIYLSTDGGQTFGTTLASGVPNNGSYTFTVPNISTTNARIKIEGAGNIFYDINNANLTINGTPVAGKRNTNINTLTETGTTAFSVYPNPAKEVLNIRFNRNNRTTETLTVTDLSGKVVLKQNVLVNAGANSLQLSLKSISSKGVYMVKVGNNKPAQFVIQ